VSINKIAEKVGINISQVYRYFPNGKPDTLIAIGNDKVQKGAPDPALPKYQDPKTLQIDLIKFYIRTHRESRKILASLQTVFLSYPDMMAQDAQNVGASDIKVLKTILQRYELEDSRIGEVTRVKFHLIDTMIHRQVLEIPITSTDEELAYLLATIVESYVKGIKS